MTPPSPPCSASLPPPSPGNTATTAGEGPTANDVNGVDVDIDTEPEFPELEGAVYLGCFQDMRKERTMKFAFANAKDLTNEVGCVRWAM